MGLPLLLAIPQRHGQTDGQTAIKDGQRDGRLTMVMPSAVKTECMETVEEDGER